MTLSPNFSPANAILDDWRGDLLNRREPIGFPVSDDPRMSVEIAPGRVVLFGGPPGAGKTAFVMQLATDALRLTATLRAIVCNVEMPPAALLDRQLARLSGIPLNAIRRRQWTDGHADRLTFGFDAIAAFAERLAFLGRPYSFENVILAADAFDAKLVVLDYVQRIDAPGKHASRKAAVDASMDYARKLADAGAAVVLVAAVGRNKDAKGRNGYQALNLASFRESSELEYGADDAYLLVGDAEVSGSLTLAHVKSRYGDRRDIPLHFTGANQRFDVLDDLDVADDSTPTGPTPDAIRAAWGEGGDA